MNLLVDAHALICRAYFGMQSSQLRTRAGEPTWAVFGFVQELLRAIGESQPDAVAVCFDHPGRTIRHELDPRYKANRGPKPADLVAQLATCRRVVDAFGFPAFGTEGTEGTEGYEGYEADDLLGTLAQLGPCEILTGDRDLFQLASETVTITIDRVRHGPQEVFDRMGVWPHQIVDFKGLAGDTSDNIPGIRGIGPKKAAAILASGENPYAEDPDFQLSRELAQILIVPDITWDQAPLALNLDTLTEIFAVLEFKSLQADLRALIKPRYLVLDFETTGLEPGVHEPIQVAAVWLDSELRELDAYSSLMRPLWPENATQEALAVHGRSLADLGGEAHPEDVLADLCDRVPDPLVIVGHNIGFDLGFLAAAESRFDLALPRQPRAICTLAMARALLPGLGSHKLAAVAAHYDHAFEAHDALADVRACAQILRHMHEQDPVLLGRAQRGEPLISDIVTGIPVAAGASRRKWGRS